MLSTVQINSGDKSNHDLKEILEAFDQKPPAKEFSVSYQINYQELNFGRELGKGSFGIVYQGTWRQHTDVAIKQLLFDDISSEASEEFNTESQMMARLRSPHIVQFYGYCPSPKRCIVMEYMPNGSLYSVLKNTGHTLDWSIRIRIAIDMASGLAFLHQEHIVHRDVKSLNVLLDKSYGAKLTDFGLSKVKTETKSQSMATKTKNAVGTIAWMAPELFERKATYTQKSDIYSFGVTLWELAARKIPFSDAGDPSLIPSWVSKGEREDIPRDCPQKLASLITACWEGSPDKRPDADVVATYLKSEQTNFAQFLPLFVAQRVSECQNNLVHKVNQPSPQSSFRANTTPQNNLEPLPSSLNSQASSAVPVATPKVCRHGNLDVNARAGRDVTTLVGGVRGREIIIGGGNISSPAKPSLNSSDSNPKEAAEVDNIAVLKQLKLFFMSNKYKGLQSQDCELYNSVLEKHKAILVYLEDERVHQLFVNDEPLDSKDSIKQITQMITSLQPLNTQSVNTVSHASRAAVSPGSTRVQVHAGRDAITIAGGVTSEGTLRIGGGDTHHNFTAYNQFQNQNANQYNFSGLVNHGGDMQFGNGNTQSKTYTHR